MVAGLFDKKTYAFLQNAHPDRDEPEPQTSSRTMSKEIQAEIQQIDHVSIRGSPLLPSQGSPLRQQSPQYSSGGSIQLLHQQSSQIEPPLDPIAPVESFRGAYDAFKATYSYHETFQYFRTTLLILIDLLGKKQVKLRSSEIDKFIGLHPIYRVSVKAKTMKPSEQRYIRRLERYPDDDWQCGVFSHDLCRRIMATNEGRKAWLGWKQTKRRARRQKELMAPQNA